MNEMNEVRKPPVATTGIIGWLRINLFFNWTNSLITLFVIYCLYQFIPWILDWTIFSADFKYNYLGEQITNQEMCSRNLDPENGGACWAVIYVRFYQFIYGFYPKVEVWRVNVAYVMLAFALLPLLYSIITNALFSWSKHNVSNLNLSNANSDATSILRFLDE